jgi:hypothetical protein
MTRRSRAAAPRRTRSQARSVWQRLPAGSAHLIRAGRARAGAGGHGPSSAQVARGDAGGQAVRWSAGPAGMAYRHSGALEQRLGGGSAAARARSSGGQRRPGKDAVAERFGRR